MENNNRMLTSKAASISLFITVILFLITLFGSQMLLPPYFFETSDYYIIGVLLELVPLGIGVLIYIGLTKQKLGDIVIFNRPQAKTNKNNMPWLIVLGAAAAILGRYFIAGLNLYWYELLEALGYKISDIALPPIDSVGVLLWALLSVAVTPAIFEELIFRGILQKGLLRNSKPKTAIIISSVLFMLMHMSVENMAFTFVAGCFLGFLAYRTGSIIPSMAFHFVNNAFSVIGLYIIELLEDFGYEMGYSLDMGIQSVIIITILAAISLFLVGLVIVGVIKLSKTPPENPYLKPMSVGSIVLIVLSGCILFLVMVFLAMLQNMMLV